MKLLELYDSVQGEGPNVGRPTTFVRFAGCNYRCPGWPCDTPYSIMPEVWRNEFEQVTPHELVQRILERPTGHVCITGGEPLLQPKGEVQSLVGQLRNNHFTVDVFTNGSRPVMEYILLHDGITIVMDWKLPGSGEGDSDLEAREHHRRTLSEHDAVKFVIKNDDDLVAAAETIKGWDTALHKVYFGPAWGYDTDKIVTWMLREGYSEMFLNVQIHKYIWDPTARRT